MSKLPQQTEYWGIDEPEIHVLFVVTCWFNGHTFPIRGEKRRIATHHELPLEDMFMAYSKPYDAFRGAHKRLLEKGLLEEKYIARRKIDWAPTEDGRQAIRECLTPWADQLRPRWADDDDEERDRVLCGDPNEGLLHRKGVEIAGSTLPGMAWARPPNGRPYGYEWYPTNHKGELSHDLHVDTMDRIDDVGVEVITSSNNIDYLVEKWKRHQSSSRLTFWIFDRRETACRLWNELDARGEFHLDGKFSTPSNWSAAAINRKIWRSASKFGCRPADDIVHTVTGLLEGDADTIHNLFDEYYSNK